MYSDSIDSVHRWSSETRVIQVPDPWLRPSISIHAPLAASGTCPKHQNACPDSSRLHTIDYYDYDYDR